MKRLRNSSAGFTLIELMIVVSIVSILSALAIPRFMSASTRTKQAEAKSILKQIYVNEHAYRQQESTNAYYIPGGPASAAAPDAFKDILIEIMPSARYTFTITAVGDGFLATAAGNIDDDAALDTWTIGDAGTLTCTCNDIDQTDPCA